MRQQEWEWERSRRWNGNRIGNRHGNGIKTGTEDATRRRGRESPRLQLPVPVQVWLPVTIPGCFSCSDVPLRSPTACANPSPYMFLLFLAPGPVPVVVSAFSMPVTCSIPIPIAWSIPVPSIWSSTNPVACSAPIAASHSNLASCYLFLSLLYDPVEVLSTVP